MDVGVRELKQHLSEFLERAARGEILTVTDRGRPKVRIVPLDDRGAVERGIGEGWLRAPSGRGLAEVQRATATGRIDDVLAADRDG